MKNLKARNGGFCIKHNNPHNKYLGVLGDENPRRFPPAEGRKGGEPNGQ